MNVAKCYFLAFALFLFISCDYEKDQELQLIKTDALLVWKGEYANNGCGFVLIVGSLEYKPENEYLINEKYKTDGMVSVSVEFVGLSRVFELKCGQSVEIEMVEVISIIEQ